MDSMPESRLEWCALGMYILNGVLGLVGIGVMLGIWDVNADQRVAMIMLGQFAIIGIEAEIEGGA